LYLTEKGYVFVFSGIGLGSNIYILCDESFNVLNELKVKHAYYEGFNKAGMVIGSSNRATYDQYIIRFFDWNFNEKWTYLSDSSITNSVLQRGLIHMGSNYGCISVHKDSSYKWVDEYLGIFNAARKKIRECRYLLEPGFRMTITNSTYDGGALFEAYAPSWDEFEGRFVKTDSLGLVYNTDIICDCKDFKREDTTSTGQYLFPELHAQLFPNPATDKINVLLSHKQKASIVLRNLNGQIVKTQQAEFNSNIIDISELKAGVYFVEVSTPKSSKVLKVVKH